MVTLGVDGLVSGLDTTSIITSLMTVEARPQALLKDQLTAAQAKASAYRAVNTRFDAIRSAAEALTSSSLAAAKTVSSSSASVTATATAAAATNSSISFTVDRLATAQSGLLATTYTSTTTPLPTNDVPAYPITVTQPDGTTTSIALPANATLVDAVSAINASGVLHATIIQLEQGRYRVQVDATETGKPFTITDANGSSAGYTTTTPATTAQLSLTNGLTATSTSNTFTDLVPGTSITVSQADAAGATPTTVKVGVDTSALTAKVKALVDAANGAIGLIKGLTVSTAGAKTATLQGDRSLVQLSDQVRAAVSGAIGGRSAATIGLQLNRDGTLAFDAAVFAAKLSTDPTAVSRLLSGAEATTTGGVTTPAVTGIAGRLAALAKTASDSSTGTLVQLANGRDSLVKGIQDRIDAFEIRLAARKDTLTKQFTALETALNTIKNQSSWLSSQVNQLYNPNASS